MSRNRRLGPLTVIPIDQMQLLRSLLNQLESPLISKERSRIEDQYLSHYRNTIHAAYTTGALAQLAELPCPEKLRRLLTTKTFQLRRAESKDQETAGKASSPPPHTTKQIDLQHPCFREFATDPASY